MTGPVTLCIAGKNQIAVDVLATAARRSDVRVLCLPTAVDRGFESWQPSLYAAAQRMDVPIVALADLYDVDNLVFLSVEYDRIIAPARFRPSARLYNIHFSLLPWYRGCNTSIWPILNGETEHGVTLHVIDPGIDTGPIIAQRRFAIGDQTARDLYFRCMDEGRELANAYLSRLLDGPVDAVAQDPTAGSSFARRALDFNRKHIDLHQPTLAVLAQVRAFTFPEYQLPMLDGRPIVAARDAGSDIARTHSGNQFRTLDGFVEFDFAQASPPAVGLRQSGYDA